jgi:hypothetical protein
MSPVHEKEDQMAAENFDARALMTIAMTTSTIGL